MAEQVIDRRPPMTEDSHAVEVRLAAHAHNLGPLRALVSAVAAFEDLTVDAIADLRLALDEAATLLIRCAVPGATLSVRVQPRPEVLIIRASVPCPPETIVVAPGSFSWHVLNSLADEVGTFADVGEAAPSPVSGISLTMRRGSSTL